MAGKGSKPGEHRGGRKKGVPNKINADLRQMILNSLESVGGQKYLETQAAENPTAYMKLVGMVLPKEIKADVNLKQAPGMMMVIE